MNRPAYTLTTQHRGDGSEPCYVVFFERQIVATFPVNDPGSEDALQYATHFLSFMNKYYEEKVTRLVANTK